MLIDGKDRQGQKKNKNKKNSHTRSHAVSHSLTTYQWTERLGRVCNIDEGRAVARHTAAILEAANL